MMEILMSDVFSSPPRYMPQDQVGLFLKEEVPADMFNSLMQNIDRGLVESEGTGLEGSFGNGIKRTTRRVFADRPFLPQDEYVITYTDADINGKFGRFLETLGKACITGDVSKMPFMVQETVSRTLRTEPSPQFVTRQGLTCKVTRVDNGPEMHFIGGCGRHSTDLPKAMKNMWDSFNKEPRGYIPSGTGCAGYDTMTDEQREYYGYWKLQAREGNFLETDSGYVWLFMSEQISFCPDRKAVMERLLGLYDAYRKGDRDGLIRETCCEFAMACHMPVPFYCERQPESACMVLSRFLTDGSGKLDPDCISTAAGIRNTRLREEFDDACCDVLATALQSISSELKRKGTGLLQCFPTEKKTFKMNSFTRLKIVWNIDITRKWLEYVPLSDNEDFCDFMEALMRDCVSSVRRIRDGKTSRMYPLEVEGIDCMAIADRSAYDLLNSRRGEVFIDKLDLDAVSSAEKDLDEVTRMMAVEDAPEVREEPQKPKTVERPKTGNKWRSLVLAMNDIERNYLLGAIDGKTGKVDHRIEDSINETALEIVGDTIVEAGRVYGEYAEDVRSGF